MLKAWAPAFAGVTEVFEINTLQQTCKSQTASRICEYDSGERRNDSSGNAEPGAYFSFARAMPSRIICPASFAWGIPLNGSRCILEAMRHLTILAILAAGSSLSFAGSAISVYSDLNIEKCKALQLFSGDKGEGGEWECQGIKGYKVMYWEGDLRGNIAFGPLARSQCSSAQSFGAFNGPGAKIEWRMENGKPFATILRWSTDNGSGKPGARQDWLVVTKLNGKDACRAALLTQNIRTPMPWRATRRTETPEASTANGTCPRWFRNVGASPAKSCLARRARAGPTGKSDAAQVKPRRSLSLARLMRLRSFGSSKILRRRMDFGVTSTSSSSSI